MVEPGADQRPPHRVHWVRLLVLLPFLAMLWVPSYNRIEPTLYGIPFFYWYQLLWVLLCALICSLVYRAES
jgi:hypothetical protein